MDFVRSYFFSECNSKLDFPVIKTLERHFFYIEWVSLQCFWLQEKSNFDERNWSDLHSEWRNFLQNPYFRNPGEFLRVLSCRFSFGLRVFHWLFHSHFNLFWMFLELFTDFLKVLGKFSVASCCEILSELICF